GGGGRLRAEGERVGTAGGVHGEGAGRHDRHLGDRLPAARLRPEEEVPSHRADLRRAAGVVRAEGVQTVPPVRHPQRPGSWRRYAQWMGHPVGPQYAASSNIDNAHRLRGKLLLIVGEMDTNVPPESTYRLCDALIKAGKDFDFVLVPGAGHGMGGTYGQRRLQ